MTEPSTDAAPITRVAHLARITGVWFFVLGFVARIPFAMNIVGLLTLVTVERGSIAEGGLASAAFGIAMGVGGPILGAIADRHGQRVVTVVVSVLHTTLLLGIVAAVYSEVPFWFIFALTLLAGATIPPVSAYARARWLALLDDDTRRGGRGVSTALGYESMVEEITFVGGPVLVGLLATLISPAAPVIVAAVAVLVFASAFGLHRTASAVQPSAAHPDAVVAPRRALVTLAVLLPVAGMLLMGAYFGTTLASLTAVMEGEDLGESTGLIYGIMGATSAVAAITVGRLPRSFPLHLRWVIGAAAMLAAGLVLWAFPQLPVIIVVFVFVGVFVGSTLVTVFTIGAESAPEGRLATNMAMLSSAVTIGQGLTVAAVGALAEIVGASVFVSVAVASGVMLLVALAASAQHTAAKARAGV